MTDPTEPENLLLSDVERLHALTALGNHYATGRLDAPDFHARSGEVAAARTLGQLTTPFQGLPGGVPLQVIDGLIVQSAVVDGGEVVPAFSPSRPSLSRPSLSQPPSLSEGDTQADLAELRKRGKLVESLDGVVVGVTLIAFLVLQIIVGWQYAWIVWPALVVTLGVPRLILRYSDADEKTYEKIKKSDQVARDERLRAANERIRELGDGRENRS